MKRYIILWNDSDADVTDNLDFSRLGKLIRSDYPSNMLPKLVAYDVYENGTVRDCVKYPHGVK